MFYSMVNVLKFQTLLFHTLEPNVLLLLQSGIQKSVDPYQNAPKEYMSFYQKLLFTKLGHLLYSYLVALYHSACLLL